MVAAATDRRAKGAGTVAAAIKDASGTALLALGLSFPILALRTEQNMANQLVLDERWGYVAVAVLLAFLARLAYLLRTTFAGPRVPRAVSPGVAHSPYLRVAMAAGAILLLAYPFLVIWLVGRAGAIKWIDNFAIQILIYVMLGWGLNIVVGLAGLLDLGYVAFYAIGAYAFALLSQHYDLGFWTCLPLAGILAAFWGILLGFPVLRLRGDYLAIVTLAFGEIIRLVAINWVDLTRGYAGLSGVPRATFFGLPFEDSDQGFAAFFGLEFSSIHRTVFLFYLIFAMAAITNWVTLRLRRLPVGRAWEALREDETACRSLGINTTNTKLTAFALGAMFGGFAGAFYVTSRGQGFVTPESFTFMESALILAIVVLGGLGSQVGVAIAAVVLIGGTELLRELEWMKQIFGRDFEPTHYRMLLFGLAMVLVMIWKPRGVISTRMPSIFLRERRVVRGDLVREGHG
jgi:branched-chain amino acid transport system permease protein